MTKRNISLDGLRVIGLLLIILAHVQPPSWLFQFRNFDVPLMIFVSGAAFALSSGNTKTYSVYLFSRIRRLVLPTWIFLSLFFGLLFMLSQFGIYHFTYSLQTIFTSYALLSGIGYVWIIRVFLLVSLISPALYSAQYQFQKVYIGALLIGYVIYEILFQLYIGAVFPNSYISHLLFIETLFYLIPYGIIAALGMQAITLKRKYLAMLFVGFIFVFIAIYSLQHLGSVIDTQSAKYPPRIYYLSYALAMTYGFFFVSKLSWFQKIFQTKVLMFISSSSLWIYLWHIFFVVVSTDIFANTHFLIKYVSILTCALSVVYAQKYFIRMLVAQKYINSFMRVLLTDAFLK